MDVDYEEKSVLTKVEDVNKMLSVECVYTSSIQ